LLQKLDLEAFDLWRTFESFMVTCQLMPHKLREYFQQLESYIVSCLSWSQGSPVVAMCEELLAKPKELTGKGAVVSLESIVKQEGE